MVSYWRSVELSPNTEYVLFEPSAVKVFVQEKKASETKYDAIVIDSVDSLDR